MKTKPSIPEVSQLKRRYADAKVTAQMEAQRIIDEKLGTIRTELNLAVVDAKRRGFTIADICRAYGTTDRGTIYRILSDYESNGGRIVMYPNADIFELTGRTPTEVKVTLKAPYAGKAEYLGYVAWHASEGWYLFPDFSFTVDQRNKLGNLMRLEQSEYPPLLAEWGEAVWPKPSDRPTREQASEELRAAPAPEPEQEQTAESVGLEMFE